MGLANHDTPPEDAVDEALMLRTVAGDERAFETLLDRHDRLLRATVQRVLSPPLRGKISISDILQEARLAAHLARATFQPRGPGSVRAWLMRIAELKAYEAVRRFTGVAKRDAGREANHDTRPDTDQLAGHEPSPSEAAVAVELADAVRRAMDQLPDDYRQALHLVAVKGLTFAVAGDRMARSGEAVRKLYGRALSSFTELLASQRGRSDG